MKLKVPPRGIKLCWECGRKFWGNRFSVLEVDGHDRYLHKACKKYIEDGCRDMVIDESENPVEFQ